MRNLLRSPLWFALLIALINAGVWASEPVAHLYWNVAYKIWQSPAPQAIVVVNVEDADRLGAAGQARLINLLHSANPKRVFIDTKLQFGLNPADDAKVRIALDRLKANTVFVARPKKTRKLIDTEFDIPDSALTHNRKVVVSGWNRDFMYYIDSTKYSFDVDGVRYPTLSTELSGVGSGIQSSYYPDFSVDPATIKTISARDLIDGVTSARGLADKVVLVTSAGLDEVSYYFGHGIVAPVAFDIAGAAALERPLNLNLSGITLLLVVFGLVYLGHNARRRRNKWLSYGGVVIAVTIVPVLLRMAGLVAYPDSAMVFVALFGGIRLWQKRTRRIQHTSAAGLSNMLALTNSELPVGCDVVVAAVARYEEMLATLPRSLHGECARQIARRIAVSSGADAIFHSDGGHFAWTEEARPLDIQLSHLEGLRALFAAPLQVGPHMFDTNIHFGLDRNEGLDSSTRVNSALASANAALNNGRVIELFEADRLAEAPWELSLHARIDEGLRNGDIWLAFQAQWDIARNRICGAEALIRWNHPTRGAIAPDAFIIQAERAGRIDALTYWVLEHAITAALAINARGDRFQMSVNLSGQMVDKPDLVANFAEIVARRGIDAGLITVEVTETSSVGNRPAAVHNLTRLRQIGFRLSIDDFGTGEASLAYLADLPSDELKIDRRFVAHMVENARERAIVAATINLAHALGQTVVAEGIEDAATLALLHELGCDLAQGFYLARPQTFAQFEREYDASRARGANRV